LSFDLCEGFDVSTCALPTTTITEIDFTGTLDQRSLAIYDPAANGGTGGAGPTFFANPTFSTSLRPSNSFPADYYESADASVTDQSATPEPATALLVLGGLLAAVYLGGRRAGRRD
jgi:hypothetical protein